MRARRSRPSPTSTRPPDPETAGRVGFASSVAVAITKGAKGARHGKAYRLSASAEQKADRNKGVRRETKHPKHQICQQKIVTRTSWLGGSDRCAGSACVQHVMHARCCLTCGGQGATCQSVSGRGRDTWQAASIVLPHLHSRTRVAEHGAAGAAVVLPEGRSSGGMSSSRRSSRTTIRMSSWTSSMGRTGG